MRSVRTTGAQVASQGCRPSIRRWGQRSPSSPPPPQRLPSLLPAARCPPPAAAVSSSRRPHCGGGARSGESGSSGAAGGCGAPGRARSGCSVCICASVRWVPPGIETRLMALESAFFLSFLPPPRGAADSINPLFKAIVRMITVMALLRFLKDVALYGGVIHRCNTYRVS